MACGSGALCPARVPASLRVSTVKPCAGAQRSALPWECGQAARHRQRATSQTHGGSGSPLDLLIEAVARALGLRPEGAGPAPGPPGCPTA